MSEKKIWCVETYISTKKADKKGEFSQNNIQAKGITIINVHGRRVRIFQKEIFSQCLIITKIYKAILKNLKKSALFWVVFKQCDFGRFFNGLESVTIVNKPQNEIEVQAAQREYKSAQ